jgi:hypothetical protein
MKLEEGDAFEVLNAQWIRDSLPSYEPIWSAFIGNNGSGWPCDMRGLDGKAEVDRKRFYQAHYSFARSMRKIADLAAEFDKSNGLLPTYQCFENETDRLFQYASHVGHVRDMFKIIDDALGCHGHLHGPLQGFYSERSHVLHGPRLPVHIEHGFLKIPRIGGMNEVFGDWTSKATWDSIPKESFVFIRDFVAETTTRLNALVVDIHGKVFDAAMKRFGGNKIAEPKSKLDFSSNVSGLTFAPAISAFNPPSGVFRG